MGDELYKRYRPSKFSELVGQEHVVKTLVAMGKRNAIPHCILLSGPSGVGKTTIARILRQKLGCGDSDYEEINASDYRGIEMVRKIRSNMMMAPISGRCRVWTIDECHQLTSDAQNSFLKILEDTPTHCYFILSTTDPQRLKRTIITRSTELKLGFLPPSDLSKLVSFVVKSEGMNELSESVIDKLVSVADGSARKALVVLDTIIGVEDEAKQLEVIAKADFKAQAIEIARLLMNPKTEWKAMADVLKAVDEDVESLRYMVLGYCRKVMLGGRGASRAAAIIDRFQDHFYDSKAAGFALACWDIVKGSR